MEPRSEMVHWLFGMGVLVLGLIMLAEALVPQHVWRRRPWRIYLWPGIAFGLGVLMWPVMTFFTNSAIHMVAHGAWAQALMAMGGAELGLARGKLHSRWWKLATPVALAVSGRRSSSTSRTPGSSPGRRSCTTSSAGRCCSRAPDALPRLPAALGRPAGRIRGRGPGAVGDALLRP